MPSVQFFERGPSKGALQSQLIGQGLGQLGGMYGGQQMRKSQLVEAFQNVKDISNKEGASQLDKLLSTFQAFTHIPGSEKYVGAVLPTLVKAMQAEAYKPSKSPYGQTTTPQTGETENVPATGSPEQKQGPFAFEPKGIRAEPTQRKPGGIYPREIPLEEIDARAREEVARTGDQEIYDKVVNDYLNFNQHAKNQVKELESKLMDYGIDKDKIPIAMKLGEQFSNLENINQWADLTNQSYQKYKDATNAIKKFDAPGFWRGLTSSVQGREQTLKRLDPSVKWLVENGLENEARTQLSELGLSPAEVEERIHPMSKEMLSSLKQFPEFKDKLVIKNGQPMTEPENREKIWNKLTDFLRGKLNEDVPLSVLRHHLAIDKNVPWEMIGPAMRAVAKAENYNFSQTQNADMVEVDSNPPIQDLSSIFLDWYRPVEYFKRAK